MARGMIRPQKTANTGGNEGLDITGVTLRVTTTKDAEYAGPVDPAPITDVKVDAAMAVVGTGRVSALRILTVFSARTEALRCGAFGVFMSANVRKDSKDPTAKHRFVTA